MNISHERKVARITLTNQIWKYKEYWIFNFEIFGVIYVNYAGNIYDKSDVWALEGSCRISSNDWPNHQIKQL